VIVAYRLPVHLHDRNALAVCSHPFLAFVDVSHFDVRLVTDQRQEELKQVLAEMATRPAVYADLRDVQADAP
jgi:hypothetical protein